MSVFFATWAWLWYPVLLISWMSSYVAIKRVKTQTEGFCLNPVQHANMLPCFLSIHTRFCKTRIQCYLLSHNMIRLLLYHVENKYETTCVEHIPDLLWPPQQEVIYPCNVRVMNMQMTTRVQQQQWSHVLSAGTSGCWCWAAMGWAHPLTNWFWLPDAK